MTGRGVRPGRRAGVSRRGSTLLNTPLPFLVSSHCSRYRLIAWVLGYPPFSVDARPWLGFDFHLAASIWPWGNEQSPCPRSESRRCSAVFGASGPTVSKRNSYLILFIRSSTDNLGAYVGCCCCCDHSACPGLPFSLSRTLPNKSVVASLLFSLAGLCSSSCALRSFWRLVAAPFPPYHQAPVNAGRPVKEPAMTVDVFSVPVFLVVFRETLETVIIVSVLLAFLKLSLGGPDRDASVYKKLRRQVSAPASFAVS